jgi:PAS domain S-box-containing protein
MTVVVWLAGALLAMVAIWVASSEVRLRMRMNRLAEQAHRVAARAQPGQLVRAHDPFAALSALHGRLLDQLAREKSALRDEADRRTHAEESLRESEERYDLAVSGANDGMWEWNLNTDAAYFSPRWKSMLGYADADIGDRIGEWHDRIHPHDRERVLVELRSHVEGRSPRFEYEHRVKHRDGSWRWVLACAAAVRHASGRAYRLVGLTSDVSARKQVQQLLLELADGMDGLAGREAFAALVEKFATALGARQAFLSQCCDYPPTRVRMLAHWNRGQFAPCEEFDLAGTPCQEVIEQGRTLVVSRGVGERWPAEQGTESYLGLPCIDTKGSVIGHIACLDPAELHRELPLDAVLRLFAVRASVEMERDMLKRLETGVSTVF